jgi:glutathione S-transferase
MMTITTAAMDASHPLWVKEWTEGAGEATIRAHSTSSKDEDAGAVSLYCSWFCPFAQRAWIAVEELGIPYNYHEINPYRVDPQELGGYTKQSLTMQEKMALYPDFIACSPRGLVPAIRDHLKNVSGVRVWESAVVMEYLDQTHGNNRLFFTSQPELAALIRICVEHCTLRIQKAYYQFLMEPTVAKQTKAKEEFLHESRILACAMAPLLDYGNNDETATCSPAAILQATQQAVAAVGGMQRVSAESISAISQSAFQRHKTLLQPGPFFLGSEFSAVDIALAPFWQRILWVGTHYRDLKLPEEDDAAFERLHQWWKAVSQRPSVANTLVGKERLISSYRQYAVNIATSDFATHTMKSTKNGDKHNNKEEEEEEASTQGNQNKKPKLDP